MWSTNYFNRSLNHRITHLYQESVIHRLLGKIRVFGKYLFDDHVKALRSSPLGMFYYNQRAISLGLGLVFLVALSFLVLILPSTTKMSEVIFVLGLFWLLDVTATLFLHQSFTRRLNAWVASSLVTEFPPLFNHFFLLDTVICLLLLATSRILSLNLDAFSFVLFANTIVYSTYIHHRTIISKQQIGIIFLIQIVVTALLFSATRTRFEEPSWFYIILTAVPLVFASLMTLFSVLLFSWLRTIENETDQQRLKLLGMYAASLSIHPVRSTDGQREDTKAYYSEKQFEKEVAKILDNLCSLGPPFWYHSACLWFIERHQDRGSVLLPGPRVNFPEADEYINGIDSSGEFPSDINLVLLHSIKHNAATSRSELIKMRQGLDIPAAFIPLHSNGRYTGVLALYAKENGPPILRDEAAFLSALGSIISTAIEQWEGHYRALLHKEMDQLFSYNSLDDVFARAARILKKYFEAAGCLIIFRQNPESPEMEIVAADGFRQSILKGFYKAGIGQTGRCAQTGQTIRFDNVLMHLDEFSSDRSEALEKAHGQKIISWMTVPIGPAGHNFGVIKFVNSMSRSRWFTDRDQELAGDIALRLQVIIEKFIYFKEIKEAQVQAQIAAQEAIITQQKAEQTARQRQDDLMIITHQLQGPLISILSAITFMQRKLSQMHIKDDELTYMHTLVEDALTLCFGTFITFALDAGRETSFQRENIDALAELKKLCNRLQQTNARHDLNFVYKAEDGLPILRMDRAVFTSVFYSLIHNAMKYAEKHSKIILECGFERATGEAVLKVKSVGLPIQPDEKELIFQKYGRGSSTKTGRSHSGVGLGLWVARQLMRAVGGDLTVELSPTVPELSVFVVHIPRTD